MTSRPCAGKPLTGELQRVHGLGGCVSVVQNDQDPAYPRNGKEYGGVLLAVPRHYANPISRAHAHGQQRPRQEAALLGQFGVGPAGAGPGNDEAFPRTVVVCLEV